MGSQKGMPNPSRKTPGYKIFSTLSKVWEFCLFTDQKHNIPPSRLDMTQNHYLSIILQKQNESMILGFTRILHCYSKHYLVVNLSLARKPKIDKQS
jgi:hypothetical protein